MNLRTMLLTITLHARRSLCLRLGLDPVWGACLWRRPVNGVYIGRAEA